MKYNQLASVISSGLRKLSQNKSINKTAYYKNLANAQVTLTKYQVHKCIDVISTVLLKCLSAKTKGRILSFS